MNLKRIEKLHLARGDVLVVKYDPRDMTPELTGTMIQNLSAELSQAMGFMVPVLSVDKNKPIDVEVLSPDQRAFLLKMLSRPEVAEPPPPT